MRCRVANYFAEKYGILGYLDAENFANKKYHTEFLNDIQEEIRRNAKAPFVCNFRENYEGGELPIYALVEIFSFGTLSKFYKNMHNKDKKAIAQMKIRNYTIYAVLLCMKHLLKNDTHWNLFVDNIELLFDKYDNVQIKTMGFPTNWKELLENK